MSINESVQGVLAQRSWKRRTLVEVANAGQFFLITEAEFNRILETERIDEGVKEWIAKARQFAAKLPANLQQAQQYVAKQTGKALDASNAAYVQAQNIINKIPLIGRIPEQTRNRLMLGLALSFAAGALSGEHGGLQAGETPDTSHLQPAGDHAAGAAGDHAAAGGGHAAGGGVAGGEHAPAATGTGTEADPHTTASQGTPEPHAAEIGNGSEGNKLFSGFISKNPTANHSMMRTQFHAVTDRMATGDVSGAKAAAVSFSEKMHLDANDKQALMQLLTKVGQAAKANGVKMH